MKGLFNRVVAGIAAILGLGIIAVKNAPDNQCPQKEKPHQTAILVRDEAREALERANKLHNHKH